MPTVIVVDAALREKLLSATGEVELRDENGVLLVKGVRPLGPPVPPPGYEIDGEWPSDEEIERRLREGKWYTTEQVLERLRALRTGEP